MAPDTISGSKEATLDTVSRGPKKAPDTVSGGPEKWRRTRSGREGGILCPAPAPDTVSVLRPAPAPDAVHHGAVAPDTIEPCPAPAPDAVRTVSDVCSGVLSVASEPA